MMKNTVMSRKRFAYECILATLTGGMACVVFALAGYGALVLLGAV